MQIVIAGHDVVKLEESVDDIVQRVFEAKEKDFISAVKVDFFAYNDTRCVVLLLGLPPVNSCPLTTSQDINSSLKCVTEGGGAWGRGEREPYMATT